MNHFIHVAMHKLLHSDGFVGSVGTIISASLVIPAWLEGVAFGLKIAASCASLVVAILTARKLLRNKHEEN